jgi:hypothetical protein
MEAIMHASIHLAALGALLVAVPVMADPPQTARQTMVHEKGGMVMPFDLDKTTHRFQPTDQGGVEKVVARDPKDSQQVALIQAHLKHEAERFSAGDFSDPAAIHGKDMPGLAQLSAGAKRIRFAYAALPDGAAISYTTADPALVTALHDWFKAQTMDHGHDAMP